MLKFRKLNLYSEGQSLSPNLFLYVDPKVCWERKNSLCFERDFSNYKQHNVATWTNPLEDAGFSRNMASFASER